MRYASAASHSMIRLASILLLAVSACYVAPQSANEYEANLVELSGPPRWNRDLRPAEGEILTYTSTFELPDGSLFCVLVRDSAHGSFPVDSVFQIAYPDVIGLHCERVE